MQELINTNSSSSSSSSSSSAAHRGKPMVVDISIDSEGAQTFKVHDSRASRKRQRYAIDEEDSEVKPTSIEVSNPQSITPNRSILRTISPSSLNKNSKKASPESSNKSSKRFESDSPSLQRNEAANDDNIWSSDVESAFLEALRMIPKNGLTKIKISGKSCGRNELISDYIVQVTGKYRTRKQVSSHIQVIKNLKKNEELIELINSGPSDEESLKRFDTVFSEIQFKKSLGAGGVNSIGTNIQRISTPTSLTKPKTRRTSQTTTSPRTPLKFIKSIKPIECQLRCFEMSLLDNSSGKSLHGLSKLIDNKLGQDLRLKPNASVSHRFPNLNQYSKKRAERESKKADFSNAGSSKDSNQPPILHNMVQLEIPASLNLSKSNFATDLKLFMKNIPLSEDDSNNKDDLQFSCLTTVYSFGNEFVKLVDEDLEIVQRLENNTHPNELQNLIMKLPFVTEFWNAFLSSLTQSSSTPSQRTIAVKSTTIEQIIYRKGSKPSEFNKSDIKAMVLWEFNINAHGKQPETTTRRLYLPNLTPSSILSTDSLLDKSVEPINRGKSRSVSTATYQSDELVDTEDDDTNIPSDTTSDLRHPSSHHFQPLTPSFQHQVQMQSQLHQQMSSPSYQQSRNNSVPVQISHSQIQHPQPQYVKRTQSDAAIWGNNSSSYPPAASNIQSYHQQQVQPTIHHFSGYNSDEFTSLQPQSFHEQAVSGTGGDFLGSGYHGSAAGVGMDMMPQFSDVNLNSFPTW